MLSYKSVKIFHIISNPRTYNVFKEEQSPISSGIWPDNRFPFKSLSNTTTHIVRQDQKNNQVHSDKIKLCQETIHRDKAFQISNGRWDFTVKIQSRQITEWKHNKDHHFTLHNNNKEIIQSKGKNFKNQQEADKIILTVQQHQRLHCHK